MNKNTDRENKFENIINNAIKNENFKEIGDLIEGGIDTALDFTRKSLSKIVGRDSSKIPYSIQNDDRVINQSPKAVKQIKTWDTLSKVSIGIHLFILAGLLLDAVSSFSAPKSIIENLILIVVWIIPALAASFYGVRKTKRTKDLLIRFRKYNREIGNNTVIPVADLAAITAKPIEFTINDLLEMIDKDYYRQARIVENGELFILDSKTYKLYKEHLLELNESNNSSEVNEDIQGIIDEVKIQVTKLTKISEEIKEPMSSKVREILNITVKIFELLRENPNTASDLDRAVKYYLPTTVKLSESYIEMSEKPTESAKSSLIEIENTMDTIKQAFLKLLDNLYAEKAMDLSSDISVLKNMLRQEGLLDEDEFKIGR